MQKASEIYQIHEYLLTECDGKMFGKDCTESCGKCLNNDQCHHVNGSCVNGCSPGYYGINCTIGTDNYGVRKMGLNMAPFVNMTRKCTNNLQVF